MDNSKRQLVGAKQVAEILGISVPYAYKIIEKLNKELEKEGYLTIHGKVDSQYLFNRYFPDSNMVNAVSSRERRSYAAV